LINFINYGIFIIAEFCRSVALPSGLKTDKTEATFEDGILTLTIPKAEEIKPNQIKVKAKARNISQDKK